MKWIKSLFCRHTEWEKQPSYTLIHYDRCKQCRKLRKTVGEVGGIYFKIGTFIKN